jgi:hypothetical protein
MARRVAKAPLKTATLEQVYNLAMRDRKFLKAFLADPTSALKRKGRTVSYEDLMALKAWLEKVPLKNWKELIDLLLTQTKAKIYPWP